MVYNSREAYKQLVCKLDKTNNIRYETHEFTSGAIMVDIWYKGLFYVIQIDRESIGISLVNDETYFFDIKPDTRFLNTEDFMRNLQQIFNC
jgi:hypothetical protein